MSAAPLSCLILDHRLCPDCKAVEVESFAHCEHRYSTLCVTDRSRLDIDVVLCIVTRSSGSGRRVSST